MISDAGISINKDTLTDMVDKLQDPKVGLVQQMPFFCDRPGFASVVEKVGKNNVCKPAAAVFLTTCRVVHELMVFSCPKGVLWDVTRQEFSCLLHGRRQLGFGKVRYVQA